MVRRAILELSNVNWLRFTLAVFVGLSFTGYFFFPSGQANNFPTYMVTLLTLYFMTNNGRKFVIHRSVVFRAALLLVCYILTSLLWSEFYDNREILSLVGNSFLIFFMVVSIQYCGHHYPSFTDQLLKLFVVTATLSSVFYLVRSGFDESLTVPQGRWNTNSVAAIGYGIAVVICSYLWIRFSENVERLTWTVCIVILVTVCIKLEVKFVWFALSTAITLLNFSKVWELRESRSVLGWMVSSALMLGILLVIFDQVMATDRQLIWQSVVDLIFEGNPLFGEGVLTAVNPIVDCSPTSQILALFSECSFQHPHNLYIALMYHGGIVGLGLLLTLFMVSFSVALESTNERKWLVLSMLSYGASIFLFDGDNLITKINYIWLIFWLPISLAISLELGEEAGED